MNTADLMKSIKAKPVHAHDCKACVHLETIFIKNEWRDLYFCKRCDDGTIISRWSSDGPEYSSYPIDIWERVRNTIPSRMDGTMCTKNMMAYNPSMEYAYQLYLEHFKGK